MEDGSTNLGRAGQSTEDISALIKAADADRSVRTKQRQDSQREEKEARARGDVIRVAINAPHKAQCDGKNLSIHIVVPDLPNVGKRAAGGGGGFIYPDFSLYDAGGGLLGIKNGTVNGILPTGMTDGGSPAYTVDVTSTTGSAYIIVTATKLAGITSVTLGNGASIPADVVASGTGSGTYYLSLGDYSCDGVGVLTIGSGASGIGSQTFNLCRDWFTVDYSARWATA